MKFPTGAEVFLWFAFGSSLVHRKGAQDVSFCFASVEEDLSARACCKKKHGRKIVSGEGGVLGHM